MNLIDQQIAIAKACGWTHTKTINNPDPTAYGRGPEHETEWDLPLPEYLNDLNAMHEAEMSVIYREGTESDLALEYLGNLIVAADVGMSSSATASHRAEAFLHTLNLWQD